MTSKHITLNSCSLQRSIHLVFLAPLHLSDFCPAFSPLSEEVIGWGLGCGVSWRWRGWCSWVDSGECSYGSGRLLVNLCFIYGTGGIGESIKDHLYKTHLL